MLVNSVIAASHAEGELDQLLGGGEALLRRPAQILRGERRGRVVVAELLYP
jgi:hypothetical protein